VSRGRIARKLSYDVPRRSGSLARRLRVEASHRHCTVRIHRSAYLGPGFTLVIPDRGTLVVGPGVQFRRGFTCEIGGDGRVTIGAGTIFTYDTLIQCSTTIDIGERCMIGHVLIVDGNHRFKDPTVPVAEQGYDFRPIRIGDETLITHGVVVTASIGTRAFIGANSVVTSPVPDYALAVGAPARVVERYGPA
jgi:acetyltransferase-like isoleucine patch superfamily enzyme